MTTQHLGGVRPEDYWEFQPGEHVMTIDGFPGVVEQVEDGPIAGAENYVIKLDNGMGGGNYSASMLAKMPTSRAAAGIHLAVEDYPELGSILDERPDPGKMTFTAALSEERQEPGGDDTPSSCSYCGSDQFTDLTDNGRVRQATCATCGGTMSAHPGAQWTPELIGDPSNHPSPAVDPRSGASLGTGAPGQAGINDFIDFDSRVSTTAASDDDWRGHHRPPGPEDGIPAHDLTNPGGELSLPEDVYTHPHRYGDMSEKTLQEAHHVLTRVRNKPEAPVTVYRSLPAEHAHKGIRPGDWVSLSEGWARDLNQGHPVVSATVPAKHLHTDADDLREFGYNGPPLSHHEPSTASIQTAMKRLASQMRERLGSGSANLAPTRKTASEEHWVSHRPPGPGNGAPLHDLNDVHGTHGGSPFGAGYSDVYSHPQHWTGFHDHELDRAVKSAEGKPDMPITVYRAQPREHQSIRTGDWVTPSASYARLHAEEGHDTPMHIVKATVPAQHVWTNADDLVEAGYHGPHIEHALHHEDVED